jgi:hypothetical protein
MAMVDSARTQPEVRGIGIGHRAGLLYRAASILSLLGRKEEAVTTLRECLLVGGIFEPDEPLYWFWAPLRDYPPFQELMKLKDEG